MQAIQKSADELHTRRGPWSATFRLDRAPVCPNCGAVLTSSQVTIYRQVAFCTRCAKLPEWFLAKHQQFLQLDVCRQHTTAAHGIIWYTPELPGPPTAAQLALRLDVAHIHCYLPLNIDGTPMEPPDGVDAADLIDEQNTYAERPSDPHADRSRRNG